MASQTKSASLPRSGLASNYDNYNIRRTFIRW